jgi:S1-C subfamily serine protease
VNAVVARATNDSARAGTASPPALNRLLRLVGVTLAAAGTLLLAAIPGGLAVSLYRVAPAAPAAGTAGQTTASADPALEGRVRSLEAAAATAPDWAKVAAAVEPSVFTIVAGDYLGSGWVVSTGRSGSELVTNYHVVSPSWEAGDNAVEVRQGDQVYPGQVVKVDPNDDLALVSVSERFPAMVTAARRPPVAEAVMAVGSPLGLDGSVATGIVSGYRSIEGSDWLQFSAPISPGNSGGPVVDGRGVVVGVSTEKAVGDGVEALAFAIPVQIVCTALAQCQDDAAIPQEARP